MQPASMASREWPLPPPPFKSSASLRHKLSREALASVDWHKPRRFESLSDGEDDEPSPHLTENGAKAFQSSAYGGHSSNEFEKHRQIEFLQSSRSKAETISNAGKVKLSAIPNVNHTSQALLQKPAPFWLNPCPLPAPFKPAAAGRNRTSVFALHAANNQKSTFNSKEPFSPEVTCLGRVKIKENRGHDTGKEDLESSANDGNTHTVDRNGHVADVTKPVHKLRSRINGPAEKTSCLGRMKRRELGGGAVVSENTATRRERAAALARTLTSLLEDLRKLEMEEQGYEPAIPPPNSLLLMRGRRNATKPGQEITIMNEQVFSPSHENSEHACYNSLRKDLALSSTWEIDPVNVDRKRMQTRVSVPLAEVMCNSLGQDNRLSEPPEADLSRQSPTGCSQNQLTLWQRRAIRKLDAIDVKTGSKFAGNGPATK